MSAPHHETVLSHVAMHAERQPERAALLGAEGPVSYRQLWDRCRQNAARLLEAGLRTGDRAVVAASSSAEFVSVYLAIHLCGAVAMPLDPGSPKPRVDYIVGVAKPKLAITSRRMDLQACRELSISKFVRPEEASRFDLPLPSPDQPADILFTTGTTGLPKGVILSHGNLFHAARNINSFIGNTGADIEILPLPLSHSFGLGRLRCNLLAGGAIRLVPGFTFPKLITDALETDGASGLAVVPAGIALLLLQQGQKLGQCRRRLRYIEIGSAPMPVAHKRRLMELLPETRICMHYGLTEASRSTFIEFHTSSHKLDSIGQPTPNVEVRIATPAGHELPPGHSGAIWVRGRMVMQGYFDNPELTRRTLRDGWLDTGDWGHADTEGYLFLEGREKELINVGGRKVAPLEVERHLNAFPGVLDSACVAIPDPKGITGEAVKAFVVPDPAASATPDPGRLSAYLRIHLEAYKIPVVYETIDAIPKTTSGKIQRLELARRAAASDES